MEYSFLSLRNSALGRFEGKLRSQHNDLLHSR